MAITDRTPAGPDLLDHGPRLDPPQPWGTSPAAVLLVDLTRRLVVHANAVAEQLAPDTAVPVSVDAWSRAAALRDADGVELAESDHPLGRVARSEPVMGQEVTAARRSEMGERREPLWVVALPMQDSPLLPDHALVVFLPRTDRTVAPSATEATTEAATEAATEAMRTAGRDYAELRERAVVATGLSFTLADADDPELPLIWVNPAFTRTTGYSLEEAVGRNCRFLQGPATDPATTARVRAALQAGEPITATLMNYRKDGVAYWNQVTISPIHGAEGKLTHFVGIQSDVSSRVEADRVRDLALASERRARAEAEAAQERLRLLAEATTQLSGTLDVTECRVRLMTLVVPELADIAVMLHLDQSGKVTESDARHRDPDRSAQAEELARRLPASLRDGPVLDVLFDGGPARLLNDLDSVDGDPSAIGVEDQDYLSLRRELGIRSAILVPLPGREGIGDILILARDLTRPQYTAEDLDVAVDLGRRAGLILDNARLYRTQQHIAETLQRSLLPELPVVLGLEVAAHYQVGAQGAQVGGDFYELMKLADGSVGLAIGDVVGHDVLAAAAMGHLKGLLRACAFDADTPPSGVLERVDTLIDGLGMPTLATAFYARLVQQDVGWQISWSNAGHPPPVLVNPDASAELLWTDPSDNDVLLGVGPSPRRQYERRLPPGATIVCYTDGLVERRGETIDDGLDRLLGVVEEAPDSLPDLCRTLLTLGTDSDDDIAVLVVRVSR